MTFEATSATSQFLLSAGMILLASGVFATTGYIVTFLRRDGAVLGGLSGMGIGMIATVVLVLDEKWFEATSATSKCLLSAGIILLATGFFAIVGFVAFYAELE